MKIIKGPETDKVMVDRIKQMIIQRLEQIAETRKCYLGSKQHQTTSKEDFRKNAAKKAIITKVPEI